MKKISKRDRQSLACHLFYSFIMKYAQLVLDVSNGKYEAAPMCRLLGGFSPFIDRFYEDTFKLSDYFSLMRAHIVALQKENVWVSRLSLYEKVLRLKLAQGLDYKGFLDVSSSEVVDLVREYLSEIGLENNAGPILSCVPVRLTKKRFFDIIRADFSSDLDLSMEALERRLSFITSMGGVNAPTDEMEGTVLYRNIAALSALEYSTRWSEEDYHQVQMLFEQSESIGVDLLDEIARLYMDFFRLVCASKQMPEVSEGWEDAKKTFLALTARVAKGDFSAFDEKLEGELTRIEEMKKSLLGRRRDAILNEKESDRAEGFFSNLELEGFNFFAEEWKRQEAKSAPIGEKADENFFNSKFALMQENLLKEWEGKPKLLVRLAMANALGALANPFGSVDALCDYLETSLDTCNNPIERNFVIGGLLRAIDSESEE